MRMLAKVTYVALVLVAGGCATFERGSTTGALRAARTPTSPAGAPEADVRGGATSSSRASRGSTAVGDFVRAREQQLQFCYREARVEHPDLTGSATVSVTLAEDGNVREASITRSGWSKKGGSRDVESCVLNRVRGWRFPAGGPNDAHVHSFAVIFSS